MEDAAASTEDADADGATSYARCNIRGCRLRGADLVQCAAEGCSKLVHLMCFQGIILQAAKGNPLPDLPDGKITCTKACYTKTTKALVSGQVSGVGDVTRGTWTTDGKFGPKDPKTSMKILLDWLLHEGNYTRYCGKDNNGVKKQDFAQFLVDEMKTETNSTRNAKQVMSKIAHIESAFREAHNFATSETGAGQQEKHGDATFQDFVRKKCPYYYELCPIMSDRSGTEPVFTNTNPSDLDNYSEYEDGRSDEDESSVMETLQPTQAMTQEPQRQEGNIIQNMVQLTGDGRATPTGVGSKPSATKRRKKTPALMDDETLKFLDVANLHSKKKMDEVVRHNRELERLEEIKEAREQRKEAGDKEWFNLEKKKFEQGSWKVKKDELDYKVNLVSQYNKLRDDGITTNQILRMCPEMKNVIDALNGEK